MRRHGTWSVDAPARDQYLIFGQPQILEEDIEEVVATLRSKWIGTGPRVAQFEAEFRDYLGVDHAVALSSCTAALHLSLLAADLRPGDEVIVPALTFAATANAVIHAGGTPILADVDRESMCIDPVDIQRRITARTRAVVPVHFAGRPCDMDAILSIAGERDLTIIEDCAHAVETRYRGRPAGSFGALGAFSFYVTKNVMTGEGGMVTTGNAEWADRIKRLALHGLSADAWKRFSDEGFRHYEVVEPGFKYNMMDLQAALGLHQLRRVETNLERRREIAQLYDQSFADLPVTLPAAEAEDTRHARHLYPVLIDVERLTVGRDTVQVALHHQKIGTGIHYLALNKHGYYRERFGFGDDDLPNASWISDRTLSLPLSPALSREDVDDVIWAVRNTLQHYLR